MMQRHPEVSRELLATAGVRIEAAPLDEALDAMFTPSPPATAPSSSPALVEPLSGS